MTKQQYSEALALVFSIFLFLGVLEIGSRLPGPSQTPAVEHQVHLQEDFRVLSVEMDETRKELGELENKTTAFVALAERLAAR